MVSEQAQPAGIDPRVGAPASVAVEGARDRIREERARTGRRTAVLDDDPTGSQSVHSVSVVTAPDPAEFEEALSPPGSTTFILTNTRSVDESDAVAVNETTGAALLGLQQTLGAPLDIVSRSDSTLRGHVLAEIAALDAAYRAVLGRGVDGVLFAPAYFEAGRFTAGDIHWAVLGGAPVPIGETEFARDATFGYRSSNLREFLVEKSGGVLDAGRVLSLSLEDIRRGGVERVAEVLLTAADAQWVVVNATEYSDLEIVVLGLQEAQRQGRVFLARTGPSFVRALAGVEPRGVLGAADIWPEGRPPGHGLVVVGSHVGLTGRQLDQVRARGGVREVELSVTELVEEGRDAHVAAAVREVTAALAHSDVMLYTSRVLLAGADPQASLRIARAVSAALVEVVRGALAAKPSWVVAKGGITSHDVAAKGLGIRRATVLGQLFPGMVSVLRPEKAPAGVLRMPYVVFAGNVGDENALADTVEMFRAPE